MARLATGHLVIPTANLDELSVRRMRERLELIFVTILTSVAAYIVLGLVRSLGLSRVGRATGT